MSSSANRWMLGRFKRTPRHGLGDSQSFERLDDHVYPLKDTYRPQTQATGPNDRSSDADDDATLGYA